jgi:hypothetical protein
MGTGRRPGGPCRVKRVSVTPSASIGWRDRSVGTVCAAVLRKEREGVPMAELDTKDREKLDKRKFAYVDKEGEGHLPINDESHVRNAMARFNQTDFESGTKKETARKKIVTAAKRRGIKVAKSDDVAKRRKTKAKR